MNVGRYSSPYKTQYSSFHFPLHFLFHSSVPSQPKATLGLPALQLPTRWERALTSPRRSS